VVGERRDRGNIAVSRYGRPAGDAGLIAVVNRQSSNRVTTRMNSSTWRLTAPREPGADATEAGQLRLVDALLLLTLSDAGKPKDAVDLAAETHLPATAIHSALRRLTHPRYVQEDDRHYTLTSAGRRLAAVLGR
jgi:hypothetical protein